MPEMTAKLPKEQIKELVVGLSTRFRDAGQSLGSKLSQTFSDEMTEAIDTFKDFGKRTFDIFTNTVPHTLAIVKNLFFQSKVMKEQVKIQKEQLKLEKKRRKEELAKMGKGGVKGFFGRIIDVLMLPFMVLASLLGGMFGSIWKRFSAPFKIILWLPMKLFRFLGGGRLLGAIGKVGRRMKWFRGLIKIFRTKVQRPLGKVLRFLRKTPGLRMLFKSLKFGFKFFGWPLNILLAVIDFIKGFTQTKGDLLAKIMGGLEAAIQGFLELPINLLGWVVDWVREKIFGVDISKKGDFAGGVKNLISGVFDWVEKLIRSPLKVINDAWQKVKPYIDQIKIWINTLMNLPFAFLRWIKKTVTPWLKIPVLGATLKGLGAEKLLSIIPDEPLQMFDVSEAKKKAIAEAEERKRQIELQEEANKLARERNELAKRGVPPPVYVDGSSTTGSMPKEDQSVKYEIWN